MTDLSIDMSYRPILIGPSMHKATLSHLETSAMIAFIEVAERGSFTAAAAALNLSQPTVSQQIQRLERVIGIKLFHRASNKVSLTKAGEIFIRHCRTALENIEVGISSALQSNQPIIENVRLGLSYVNIQRCLSPILKHYHQHDISIGVEIVECMLDELVEKLQNQTLDVAIVSFPVPHRGLKFEELYHESLALVMASSHPLAAIQDLTWDNIMNEPVILPRQNSNVGVRATVENFYRTHHCSVHTVAEVNGYQSLRQLLLLKYGLTFLPYSQVRIDVENGFLVAKHIVGLPLTHTVAIATSTHHPKTPAIQQLINVIHTTTQRSHCQATAP